MSVLSINYDLKKPGRDYEPLYEAIRSYSWCRILESCWLIDTQKTTGQVRDHLKSKVDSNDEIFVVRLRKDWATNFSDKTTEWLKSSSRTWD